MRWPVLVVLLPALATLGSAQDAPPASAASLASGDWVGEFGLGDSAVFVRARFTALPSGVTGKVDLPREDAWDLALSDVDLVSEALFFGLPFRGGTAHFEGSASGDAIDGELVVDGEPRPFHLIHRMEYDSDAVRRLTGNYRIAADRVISMGPLDEAGGWLAFFDSRTRRGGILQGMSETVFFTGPTFGIDYPVAIRAEVRLDGSGGVRALSWGERGQPALEALRLDDHVSQDVKFQNGPVVLAGTVTVPRRAGRHPAVILIHGAGGTIPTRDFGYWSSYFSGHGLAVLAFDKRGGGASGGDANTATYEDLADDVLAGLTYLQSRSDVDPDRIGFYGTSNGGYIAPLAATRSQGRVAFITVRSGSARKVGDNIAYEVASDLRSQGFSEPEVSRGVAIRQRVTDFVIGHPTITAAEWSSLVAEVSAVSGEPWFPWARVAWVPLVSPGDASGAAYLDKLRSEWRYDPIPYWREVRSPVYILLGRLDRSVPSDESAPLLRRALEEAGNRDATVRVFERGNHGLLEAHTGYDSELHALSHYVEGFQDGLIEWIEARVRPADER